MDTKMKIKAAKKRMKNLKRDTNFKIDTAKGSKSEIAAMREGKGEGLKIAIKSYFQKRKQKSTSNKILNTALKRGIKRIKSQK